MLQTEEKTDKSSKPKEKKSFVSDDSFFSIPDDAWPAYLKTKNHIRQALSWVGLDILRENYKPNIFLYKCIFFMGLYLIANINAVMYYWSTDMLIALHSTSTLGVPFQAYSKLCATLVYKKKFQENAKLLDRLHNNADGEYRKALNTYTKIIFIISKSLLVLYICSVIIFASIPLIYFILDGKLQLAIEIILPFSSPSTKTGFYINLIYEIYGFMFACAGMSGIDGTFIFFSFQGLGLVRTTTLSFREISTIVENDKKAKDDVLIKRYLREVVERYFLMQSYVSDMSDCFSMTNLSHVASSSLSLALCLFIATVDTWIIAKVLVLCFLYQLTAYMIVGTLYEIKFDELCDEIGGVPWYKLSKEMKKWSIVLIQNSQTPTLLSIGGLAPLNLSSELGILKTIYSYYTILLTTIKG